MKQAFVTACLALSALSAWTAHAQIPGPSGQAMLSNQSTQANFVYARPGELTIFVDVWGAVRAPGLYEVSEGTHLSTLLSYAGGPPITTLGEQENQIYTLRIYRGGQGGEKDLVYETVMQNEVSALEGDPVLQSGDLFTAEMRVKQRFNWRSVLEVASSFASITLLLLRIQGAIAG